MIFAIAITLLFLAMIPPFLFSDFAPSCASVCPEKGAGLGLNTLLDVFLFSDCLVFCITWPLHITHSLSSPLSSASCCLSLRIFTSLPYSSLSNGVVSRLILMPSKIGFSSLNLCRFWSTVITCWCDPKVAHTGLLLLGCFLPWRMILVISTLGPILLQQHDKLAILLDPGCWVFVIALINLKDNISAM